jgi:ribosome-binding factor A
MTLKQERVADRIREILSELLLFEVADPALSGVTVTDVTIDRELEYASVYVNALGDETRREEVLAGLRRAGGFLRREMGRQLQLRRVPEIRWYWDETLSHTDKIEALLNTLDLPKSDPAARPDDEGDDDE